MKRFSLIGIFFFFFFSTPLFAVMQNHYLLGTYGLDSAIKPEYGTVLTNLFKNYRASELKNKNGDNFLLHDRATFNTNLIMFSCYPGLYLPCIGGSAPSYGYQMFLPFVNLVSEYTFLNQFLETSTGGYSLGDVYVEPVNITWRGCYYNLYFAYGIYFPTGKFKIFSLNNCGLGCFGNLFSFASTFFFDSAKTFTASFYLALELHGKKRGIDYYPGDNLTVDFGIGKTFWNYLSVGLVGYAERQITYDHGKDVPFALQYVEDQVCALGPEVKISFPRILPWFEGELLFRWEKEFAAKARTQGQSFIGAVVLLF